MENFKVADWVVPLFEEEKRVARVLGVGKALEVETDEGSEISASCNYRHATKTEIDEEVRKRRNPIKSLTKQQKLEVLSKAIDEGANIDINFHNLTQSKAALLTNEIAGMMGKKAEEKSGNGYRCYQANDFGFMVNAFYKPKPSYMLEDVERTIEEGVEM